MTYLIEQLINGICQGAIYALFAIGYTIIVGVVGLVSFTFGEVIMIGAFAALFTATLTGGNILLTILFSFAASGLIGIVIHKICYEKFFESARYIPLICTIGMSMLIKNTVQILFGSETKAMPEVIPLGGIQIGNYRITYVQCTVMVVVTVLCILLSIFLNKTKQGVILRAVSQDRKAAAMVGIDVSGATLMGNVLGCGIGGVAGMLYALYYGSLSASMGGMATMKAFSSSVLGGLVDIQASAIGGLLIGILENYGIALFSSSLRDMIAFVSESSFCYHRYGLPDGIHCPVLLKAAGRQKGRADAGRYCRAAGCAEQGKGNRYPRYPERQCRGAAPDGAGYYSVCPAAEPGCPAYRKRAGTLFCRVPRGRQGAADAVRLPAEAGGQILSGAAGARLQGREHPAEYDFRNLRAHLCGSRVYHGHPARKPHLAAGGAGLYPTVLAALGAGGVPDPGRGAGCAGGFLLEPDAVGNFPGYADGIARGIPRKCLRAGRSGARLPDGKAGLSAAAAGGKQRAGSPARHAGGSKESDLPCPPRHAEIYAGKGL